MGRPAGRAAAWAVLVVVPAAVALLLLGAVPGGAPLSARGAGEGAGAGTLEPHLPARVLVALAVVLALTTLARWATRPLGAGGVAAQLLVGVLVGPSVLGQVAPGLQADLFPADVRAVLSVLAGLGVVLFVFALGLRVDLRDTAGPSLLVGSAALAVPAALAVLAATAAPGLLADARGSRPALAFFALSLSVTAFPVLARILVERGLAELRVGRLLLGAAGLGDLLAWALLAVVLAAGRGDGLGGAAADLAALAVLVAAAVLVVRPLLPRALAAVGPAGGLAVLVLLLAAAAATDALGFHLVLGAFLAGLVAPRDAPAVLALERAVAQPVDLVLVPLFLVGLGLGVDVGPALGSTDDLALLGLVLAVAVVGKAGAGAAAALLAGETAHDARIIGIGMNCRGLTELVVLQTGLAAGLLDPDLFAVLVVMTLVTTLMTEPLLARAQRSPSAR